MNSVILNIYVIYNSKNILQRLREISITHGLGRMTMASATDPADLATTVSFRPSLNAIRNCLINLSNDHLIHVHTFAHDTNISLYRLK